MNDKSHFKVVGVRVLDGCSSSIHKVLVPNRIYFFYKEYQPSEEGEWVVRKQECDRRVPEDFFDLKNGDDYPHVNISAIVGKNGDGKSSLVELFIRILNNVSAASYQDKHDTLRNIPGLNAELFFSVDDNIHSFICRGEKAYYKDSSWSKTVEIDKDFKTNYQHILFYTDVTNYSIYAYNSTELNNEATGWIDSIFHKNDGYQTPIVLNPMRTKGIMDINNEIFLSRQRLMVLFMEDKDGSGMRSINDGCKAVGFRLQLKDSSAIHNDFRKYCEKTAGITELKETKDFDKYNIEIFLKNLKLLHDSYPELVKIAKESNEGKDVDLKTFIHEIRKKQFKIQGGYRQVKGIVESINYRQLEYLMLIAEIDACWKKESIEGQYRFEHKGTIATKGTINRSLTEKAYAYLIHKTLSIFENYSDVFGFRKDIFGVNPLFKREVNSENALFSELDDSFDALKNDITHERSHITLKLRQTLFFLMYSRDNGLLHSYTKRVRKHDGRDSMTYTTFEDYRMSIDSICKKRNIGIIELLPPPIFTTDFIMQRNAELYADTQLSSGEKQRLYSTSSVLYHLRNINDIAPTNNIRYRFVNLIFEEIELYFHPAYQQGYIKYLLEQIYKMKLWNIDCINMCFVTHSPFILSDIPRSNVLFMKNGEPHDEMQEDTFGANIQSMLQHGFLLEGVTMGTFAKDVVNDIFKKLNEGTVTSDMEKRIKLVGEPYIRGQLLKLYHSLKPDSDNRIKALEQRIAELERRLNR